MGAGELRMMYVCMYTLFKVGQKLSSIYIKKCIANQNRSKNNELLILNRIRTK